MNLKQTIISHPLHHSCPKPYWTPSLSHLLHVTSPKTSLAIVEHGEAHHCPFQPAALCLMPQFRHTVVDAEKDVVVHLFPSDEPIRLLGLHRDYLPQKLVICDFLHARQLPLFPNHLHKEYTNSTASPSAPDLGDLL